MTTLLLVGTTGLVGTAVRKKALDHPRVDRVIALSRREVEPAERLQPHVVDFDNLDANAPYWGVDAVICTLGTTRAKARSRRAFRRVDHDYPLAVARHARAAGTLAYVLNSAMGASTRSPFFYFRTKGQLEENLRACHFPSLTIVRPGLITGNRAEHRVAEGLAVRATQKLERILPRRWHSHPAERVATTLLVAALNNAPGTYIKGPEQITDWPESPFL